MYSHLTRILDPVSLLKRSSFIRAVLPTLPINPFRIDSLGLTCVEYFEMLDFEILNRHLIDFCIFQVILDLQIVILKS